MSERDTRLAMKMIKLIQEEYPTGDMPVSDILVAFGMPIAAAVSAQPFQDRKRVAKAVSEMILHPPEGLKAYRSSIVN